jgi:glucose/arabinose dehydrogenase
MRDADGVGTSVGRARLEGHRLVDGRKLFDLMPRSNARQHFGSRLVFDGQGHLYITLGDRGERDRAQDLGDHAGSPTRRSSVTATATCRARHCIPKPVNSGPTSTDPRVATSSTSCAPGATTAGR